MPVQTSDLFWLLAEEVRECICNSLADEAECGCPCRSCTIVGDPADDDCCEGQLTVGLNRIYVHDNFPTPAIGPVFCASPLAGEYTIQLLRCAPVVKDDGASPTCPELSDSARQVYSEMYIAVRALICCLAAAKRARKFMIREAVPIDPHGGCTGFKIVFIVELPDPPV